MSIKCRCQRSEASNTNRSPYSVWSFEKLLEGCGQRRPTEQVASQTYTCRSLSSDLSINRTTRGLSLCSCAHVSSTKGNSVAIQTFSMYQVETILKFMRGLNLSSESLFPKLAHLLTFEGSSKKTVLMKGNKATKWDFGFPSNTTSSISLSLNKLWVQ